MEFNIEEVKHNLQEYKELTSQLKELQLQNVFLLDINSLDEYKEQIEKSDNEISLLKDRLDKIYLEDNSSCTNEQLLEELQEMKQKYDYLTKISEILYQAWNLKVKIKELEDAIVRNCVQSSAKKKNKDIHSLFNEAKNFEELKVFIDAACISFYHVPLLVALITKDPTEIEKGFQVLSLNQELRDKVMEYIEQKKEEINSNLLLSDKALIDLIEHTTGKNIVDQQRHNERVSTGFNRQLNGQVLLEREEGYSLLSNQGSRNQSTIGASIKRFNEMRSSNPFDRRDNDMLVRNYPDATTEDLIYRSFTTLPEERKRLLISTVISNLELCYEMFQRYYLSDKVEIPVLVNLTNGKTFQYKFEEHNLPHILGIPSTHDRKTGTLNLPQETINLLGLRHAGAFNVLESIIAHKDEIINKCGLNYDSKTHTYYEMFPWEKIILKTNAFIRGDFFKTTSLISPTNPNSFLIQPKDEIKRISITPTKFSQSAIRQTLIDPNLSFEESVRILRTNSSPFDFTFKGMMYDSKKGIWIPKTNVSAIGERITPYNASTLKTLEKYRYLLSDVNPSTGGFVVGIKSSKDDFLKKDYSIQDMLEAFSEIENSFGTLEEIEYSLRGYLEQLQQVYYDRKKTPTRR